jgi:hypothetical protein
MKKEQEDIIRESWYFAKRKEKSKLGEVFLIDFW